MKKIIKMLTYDSFFNIILRGNRSLIARFSAWLLWVTGSFDSNSQRPTAIGRGFRFIGVKNVCFKKKVSFGIMARIETYDKGMISFGYDTSFGDYFHAGSIRSIKIGNNVLGGSNILIIDHNHGSVGDMKLGEHPPRERSLISKGGIVIEDSVWLCDGVTILSNVRIGEGSIIGPGVVVRDNVKPRSLVLE